MRYLFYLLFFPLTSIGQLNISAKITDNKGRPLPLTNIVSLKSNNGTITNELGEFELKNLSSKDTIKITNITFMPKLIPVDSLSNGDVIILFESIKNLNEVIVKNFNSYRNLKDLGFYSFSTKGEFLLIPGNQLAIHIANPLTREGWVKKVSFKIKKLGKCKNSMRIRLLEVDSITQFPSLDILSENIIIANNELKKKNIIDLSEYKILMPQNGIFVMIEWLYPDKDCDKNSYTSIVGNLETQTNEVWLNFRDKKWGHSNRPRLPNGNYITPNIGVEVAF